MQASTGAHGTMQQPLNNLNCMTLNILKTLQVSFETQFLGKLLNKSLSLTGSYETSAVTSFQPS